MSERELWTEERRGVVVLLAALADYDADALRRAGTDDSCRPERGISCSPLPPSAVVADRGSYASTFRASRL